MRVAMLAPQSTVRGPLPKLTAVLADALGRLGCEVEHIRRGRRTEDERLPAKLAGRASDVASARRIVNRGRFRVVVVHTAHDWRTLARDIALVRALRAQDRVIVARGARLHAVFAVPDLTSVCSVRGALEGLLPKTVALSLNGEFSCVR